MNKKGFTLIELLVSIAILALLVSIALISYTKIFKNTTKTTNELLINEFKAAAKKYGNDFTEDVIEEKTIILNKESLIKNGYLDNSFENNGINGVVRITFYNKKINTEYFDKYKTINLNITNGKVSDYEGNYSENVTKYFIGNTDTISFKIIGNESYGNPSSTCSSFIFDENKASITGLSDNNECTISFNNNYKVYLKTNGNGTISNNYILSNGNKNVTVTPENKYSYAYTSCTNNIKPSINGNTISFDNINKDGSCIIYFKKKYTWKKYNASVTKEIERHQCVDIYGTEIISVGNEVNHFKIALDYDKANNANNYVAYKEYNFNNRTGLFTLRDPRKNTNYVCNTLEDDKFCYGTSKRNGFYSLDSDKVTHLLSYNDDTGSSITSRYSLFDYSARIFIPIIFLSNHIEIYFEYGTLKNREYYHYLNYNDNCTNGSVCNTKCFYYTSTEGFTPIKKKIKCSVSAGKIVNEDYIVVESYSGTINTLINAYNEKPENPKENDYYLLFSNNGYTLQKYDGSSWIKNTETSFVKGFESYYDCVSGTCTKNIDCNKFVGPNESGNEYFYTYGDNYSFSYNNSSFVTITDISESKYPDEGYSCEKDVNGNNNMNMCYYYVKVTNE